MKTLFLLRHAKSSWDDASLRDRDRPLNPRGMNDAPRMAQWLAQQTVQPNCIVASPAVRTMTTAHVMAEALGLSPETVNTDERIYDATLDDLVEVVQGFEPLVSDRILLVGHNPGLTALLNRIDHVTIDNVPTCGLAIVQFMTKTWEAIAMPSATLVSFQYPKQLD
ncbi:MAG: histidine phosphatase family protein [Cyanothece sp. SIO2G6]|nr:histidine phosphatase family protein [Cyanothece sp. SIO2G6]